MFCSDCVELLQEDCHLSFEEISLLSLFIESINFDKSLYELSSGKSFLDTDTQEVSLRKCFDLGMTPQEILLHTFEKNYISTFSIEHTYTVLKFCKNEPSRTEKTFFLAEKSKEYVCSYVFKEFYENASFDQYILKEDLSKYFYKSALEIYKESYDKKRG